MVWRIQPSCYINLVVFGNFKTACQIAEQKIVLDENLEEVLDLSGCTLDNVLYYVSQGKPVLALTEASDAVLIVGYDPQNTILFDPDEGIRKMGINDSREFFEEAGNLFIGYR